MRTAAIDLGGTAIKLGVFDGGLLIAGDELTSMAGQVGLDEVADRLDDLLGNERAQAIGIAVPGVVDPQTSSLLAAHGKYAELHGLDLAAWSRSRFGCPGVVENDARAALIGEIADGSARGAENAVLIVLGTGIGAAAVLDGRVVRGARGHGAILGGHITVDLDGPRCPLRQHRVRRGAREHVGTHRGCRGGQPRPGSRTGFPTRRPRRTRHPRPRRDP